MIDNVDVVVGAAWGDEGKGKVTHYLASKKRFDGKQYYDFVARYNGGSNAGHTIYHNGKKFEVSFLCGNKKLIEGHFLRHNIFEAQEKITIPKHFIYTAPWDGGKDRCWESMYHIAIENSRNKNFFTEKIVDAFLTKTIPVYWGCPNIDEFFNTDGIITFNNVDELTVILNNLTYEFYESKKDIIEENYNKAKQYADFVKRIKEFLEEICKLNNI
jgi:hypothetical protein